MTNRPPIPEAAEEIIGGYFPVLDHGFVSLVDVMGSDEGIERAARVSYGAGTRKKSETRGLLRYLRRHHHTSPTEMCELLFHCSMPIFVARQWVRHRTASINEYSGRYSLMPLIFYTPKAGDFRSQSKTNKQGRAEVLPDTTYTIAVRNWYIDRQEVSAQYNWLIEEDVARELARIDLPLSTYTQWYWKIDLHNLLKFLTLRVDSHAQGEFQEYGKVIAGMVQRVAPLTYEAWIDYDVCGVRFSRQEQEALSMLLGGGWSMGDVVQSAEMSGLSGREVDEFKDKIQHLVEPVPDFSLDLSEMQDAEMQDAEYFAPKEDDE